jgi:L,D-peptidoglycan transpeptidase YkuD (ErfK/YbiS/YcfS/YnhG family)
MRAIVTLDGVLTFGTEKYRAAIGRGGGRADKREGDAAPVCSVPVEAFSPDDGWCDDPAQTAYNQRVRLPIDGSSETLWRDDSIYDIIGVLGWNDAPVRPGRGSAIFLHLARNDYAPTDGCVALAADDLRRVLAAGLTEIVVTQ